MGSLAERDLVSMRNDPEFRDEMDHEAERLIVMDRLSALDGGTTVADLLADTHVTLDDLAEIVAEMRGYGHDIEIAVVPAQVLSPAS